MRRDLLSRSMRRRKDTIKVDLKDVMLFTMLIFHDTWILVIPAYRPQLANRGTGSRYGEWLRIY
jgi:hypothetical protein